MTTPSATSATSINTIAAPAAVFSAGIAVSGGLNATQSPVSMLGNGLPITVGNWSTPTTFQVTTDGFVVGVVGWPSNPTDGCLAWMFGMSGDVRVLATGGNVGYFGAGWSDFMGSNGNSFLLPVAAGNVFSIGAQQNTAGQQSNAPLSAYWIPVGSGSLSSTVEQIASIPNDLPPPKTAGPDSTAANNDLISALEQAFGKTVGAAERATLLAALQRR